MWLSRLELSELVGIPAREFCHRLSPASASKVFVFVDQLDRMVVKQADVLSYRYWCYTWKRFGVLFVFEGCLRGLFRFRRGGELCLRVGSRDLFLSIANRIFNAPAGGNMPSIVPWANFSGKRMSSPSYVSMPAWRMDGLSTVGIAMRFLLIREAHPATRMR